MTNLTYYCSIARERLQIPEQYAELKMNSGGLAAMRHKLFFIFTLAAMLLMGASAKADDQRNKAGEKSEDQQNRAREKPEDQRNRNDEKPDNPNQSRRGFSGTIFVTTATGAVVSGNRFASKCAVYLDGGPGPHAPPKWPGLPDGDYYFQVTDLSGQVLLSTDPVSNRKFRVSGGVITAYTGTGGPAHTTGVDQDSAAHGAITIPLANSSCPTDYLRTPNVGNVYKVWVTPVASFVGKPANVDNPCGQGCFHGFEPSKSKSDNFTVQSGASASFCLTMQSQFFDDVATSFFPDLLGWGITVTDALGVSNHYTTDFSTGHVMACQLSAGTYTVTQDLFDLKAQTPPIMPTCVFVSPYQTILNGVVQATSGTVTFSGSTQPVNVTFVNQIVCPG